MIFMILLCLLVRLMIKRATWVHFVDDFHDFVVFTGQIDDKKGQHGYILLMIFMIFLCLYSK